MGRWTLAGVWVLSTLAATLVAWGAVRLVAEQVSPAGGLPVPNAVALAGPEAGEGEPDDEAEGEPEDEPEDDAQPQTAATTDAYHFTGGVVTVRYQGTTASLVEASPKSGFAVEVHDGGPDKVDVRFRSDDHESRFVTRVRNGEPDPQREERPR